MWALGLGLNFEMLGSLGLPFAPPKVGATNPFLYADFSRGNYYFNGTLSTLSSFLTASGASYSGPSSKYVTNASGVITSITPSLTNLPFDYNQGALQGLLLEGPSTNLHTASNTFSTWSYSQTMDTANAATGPDGSNTATSLLPSTTGTGFYAGWGTFTPVASTPYTFSLYVKSDGRQFIQITIDVFDTLGYADFDIVNGVVGNTSYTSSSITPLGNGWFRISVTNTSAATPPSAGVNICFANSLTDTRNIGTVNAGNETQGYYVFGAQIEELPFASSYIPTSGATAARSVDLLEFTPTGGFATTAQTILAAFYGNHGSGAQAAYFALSDGTTTNRIDSRIPGANAFTVNSTSVAAFANNPLTTGLNQIAGSASVASGLNVVVNAGSSATATLSAEATSLTKLQLGGLDIESSTTGENFYGDYAIIATWPVAATAGQLQALT